METSSDEEDFSDSGTEYEVMEEDLSSEGEIEFRRTVIQVRLTNFTYRIRTDVEQLVGFYGRCKFRQYMPSKPEPYGVKFWLLVCAKSNYVWKIHPYLGKSDDSPPEKN